jgi:selenocysteine lyase/cysteine desulfurase
VDFIAGLGTGSTRRERLVSGFERIERHENALAGIIRQGLTDVPGLSCTSPKAPRPPPSPLRWKGSSPATYAGNSATDTASLPPMGIITRKRSPTGWA